MNPCISIVVPVYNVEKYLDLCVRSIVAQSYPHLQIILVDDGSTDNSGKMCDEWAQRDSRISVIHQANRGLSGARNTGIEAATGEYLMFADSDDILSPVLCQTLYDLIADADIAVCDPVHIFPNKPWSFQENGTSRTLSREEAICGVWYQTAFLPSAWGKLYRRFLFNNRTFTEGRLYEDIDLIHEVIYDANKVVYTSASLYGYVHRENSITTKAFSVRDLDILIIAQKLMSFAANKPALQAAAKAYAVTAALRVYLNAPRDLRSQAKLLLDTHAKAVYQDPCIRRKNRYALMLYFVCKPALRLVYKHINRWK